MSRSKRKPRLARRIRFSLEAGVVSALARLIPLFPRAAIRRAGQAIGWVVYWTMAESRQVARANLRVAFGDRFSAADRDRVARRSVQNAIATVLMLFWSTRLNQENLSQIVESDENQQQHVRELLARGNGLVFVTFHYGDWELLGLATAFYGITATIVSETRRNHRLSVLLDRLRSRSGNRLIPQHLAVTKLFKALKRGEAVALLIDLNAPSTRGGAWVDFFGLPVYNNTSAAALALRTGAPIVAAVAHPLPGGRGRIETRQVTHQPTGNPEADRQALSQECLAVAEDLIRDHPEHWLWTYKRWKRRPSLDPGRYPYYARYARGIGSDG